MKPDVVVDVGNSRIKWGWCRGDRVTAVASLPHDDHNGWETQLHLWKASGPLAWAVAGVQPRTREHLVTWLQLRGDQVRVLDDWQQLGLEVLLPEPDRVGIDRLFNAVAARHRLRTGVALVIVDAGSAVTVDWLNEAGAFGGGAIFPGLRLMSQALHDYTALLPLVEIRLPIPPMPGTSTREAIEAGVFWTVVGGIQALTTQLTAQARTPPDVLIAGGDAPLLLPALGPKVVHWPEMTLEGIRLAAANEDWVTR